MIEIKDFSKKYSNKNSFAAENITFTVPEGKITGILGPNGSGKSTIIKAVCGFHYPTNGNIFVSGINVSEHPEQIMKVTGYVPEISILPPDMKVYDFLDYAADIHNLQNKKDEINNVIKLCSLESVINKKIKTLSKGFQQRVSLAQSIIHNPENLILDEVISGLDPKQIVQMRNLIKELSKNKAILLSTHILQEVYSLCDQIYILNKGKIAAGGTEEQILRETSCKTLEEAFIKLTDETE